MSAWPCVCACVLYGWACVVSDHAWPCVHATERERVRTWTGRPFIEPLKTHMMQHYGEGSKKAAKRPRPEETDAQAPSSSSQPPPAAPTLPPPPAAVPSSPAAVPPSPAAVPSPAAPSALTTQPPQPPSASPVQPQPSALRDPERIPSGSALTDAIGDALFGARPEPPANEV